MKFCKKCEGLLNRNHSLCIVCDAVEIKRIKRKRGRGRASLNPYSVMSFYNKHYAGRGRSWLRINARGFFRRMQKSLALYFIPVYKGRSASLDDDSLEKIFELSNHCSYDKDAGVFSFRKINIMHAPRAVRANLRRALYEIITEEIFRCGHGLSATVSTSKSLCTALIDYEIKDHVDYIANLLNEFGLDPELQKYRRSVIFSDTATKNYENGKGLATMTEEDYTAAGKKGYAAGLGKKTSADLLQYGLKGCILPKPEKP